jgi:hypothetical protein
MRRDEGGRGGGIIREKGKRTETNGRLEEKWRMTPTTEHNT